jgi:hypothetical protein
MGAFATEWSFSVAQALLANLRLGVTNTLANSSLAKFYSIRPKFNIKVILTKPI